MKNSLESGSKNVYDVNSIPTEIVIARFDIILKSIKPLPVPKEFRFLFRKEKLTYGTNVVRLPVINLSHQRSLNKFLKKFPQCIMRAKTPIFEEMEWI